MSVAPVPSSPFDIPAARKQAHAFRGSVLNSYGRFEIAVTRLLHAASLQPDYAALVRKPPMLLSQKLDLLARLAQAEGPWKAKLTTATTQLQGIRQYDEIRNLLSHGSLKVAKAEGSEIYYIFSMLRHRGLGLESHSCPFTVAEADALRLKVNQLANTAVQVLGRIPAAVQPVAKILPIPA